LTHSQFKVLAFPHKQDLFPVPKEGEAMLKVIYDGEWSGNILDSGFDSASYDGTGNYAIVFPCADFGTCSLSAQKMNEGNHLMQLFKITQIKL
jgi:hypothetical protein